MYNIHYCTFLFIKVAQLKKYTVRQFMEADVIIASYRIFYSPVYQQRVQCFLHVATKHKHTKNRYILSLFFPPKIASIQIDCYP